MSILLAKIAAMHRSSSGTFSTWNPSDKAAGVTLSNGNLDMAWASGTTWGGVRAQHAVSSGKAYFESQCLNANNNCLANGVMSASGTLANYVGDDVNGYGLNFNFSGGLRPIHNNTFTTLTAGGVCSTGDRMMCAVDFGAGMIWFGTKGVWSGSPSAGTGACFAFTPGTALYAAGSAASGGSSRIITNPLLFTYAAPTGFTGTF